MKTPKWMMSRMARKAKTTQFKTKSYGTNRGRARKKALMKKFKQQISLGSKVGSDVTARQSSKRINTRSSVRK